MGFKICLIGCGRHSRHVHGPSLRHYVRDEPDAFLAGVCDLKLAATEAFRREFGFARAYTDVEAMIAAEQPHAVIVVLPPPAVTTVCRALLEKGMPVLIEKPPALTDAGLQDLIAWARAGGAPTQVAFNRRYTPLFVQTLQDVTRHTTPEDVFQIDYEMVRWGRRDTDFSTTAIHALDTVLFLARSPYERVWIRYHELPEYGAGVANIELSGVCESGTRIRISFQPMAGLVTERATIHALNHTWSIDVPVWSAGGQFRHWKDDTLVAENSTNIVGSNCELHEASGFAAEIRAFFTAVQTGETPTPSLAEAIQPVVLMEAIRQRTTEVDFTLRQYIAHHQITA